MRKSLVVIISLLTGMIAGGVITTKLCARENALLRKTSDRYQANMNLFDQWLTTMQDGKNIAEYFYRSGFEIIAIYGMGYIGEKLYEELRRKNIDISYVIDRNVNGVFAEVEVVSPDNIPVEVDVIVVTPIHVFEEIKEELEKKTSAKIVSLDDVLDEV